MIFFLPSSANDSSLSLLLFKFYDMSLVSCCVFSLFCCTVVVVNDDFSFVAVVVAIVAMVTVGVFFLLLVSGSVSLKGTFSYRPELPGSIHFLY